MDITSPRVREDFILSCDQCASVEWYNHNWCSVGGIMVMVEFPVTREAILHFVVCNLASTDRNYMSGSTTTLCLCQKFKLKDREGSETR